MESQRLGEWALCFSSILGPIRFSMALNGLELRVVQGRSVSHLFCANLKIPSRIGGWEDISKWRSVSHMKMTIPANPGWWFPHKTVEFCFSSILSDYEFSFVVLGLGGK